MEGGEEGKEPHKKPRTQRGDDMKSNTFTTCSQPTVEANTVRSSYSNKQTVSTVTDTDNRKQEAEAELHQHGDTDGQDQDLVSHELTIKCGVI